MVERILKIGTRGSALALEQAYRVQALLKAPNALEIIRTSGDHFAEKPLGEHDGIGFFTTEIEQALLEGRIDLAVHSLKDLPTSLKSGLALGAVLPRDDASDILLVRPEAVDRLEAFPLKPGRSVGISSRRRTALLQRARPDLMARPIRGNVTTRLEKVLRGDYDAIILSRAGLLRLGLEAAGLEAFDLNPEQWIGAPGQGVIAVEVRENDENVLVHMPGMNHQLTQQCTQAERSLLVDYGGGCHAPFGARACPQAGGFRIYVVALARDGIFRGAWFDGLELPDAQKAASSWILAGCLDCAATQAAAVSSWLARQATPWR